MEAVFESNRCEQAEPDTGSDIQALKALSKSWTADEWEAHLQSLEVGLVEYLPSTAEIATEDLSSSFGSVIDDAIDEPQL